MLKILEVSGRKKLCYHNIHITKSVPYSGFFWESHQFVWFVNISLRCHHGWCKANNFKCLPFCITGNCLSGVPLVHFLLVISAVFFVIKLVVFMLAYIMSIIVLVLKGQKILFQSFTVRLGERKLGILLAFNQFVFPQQKR